MDETTIERINLGHASAYAYYKAGGGTGTEEEFTQWMADLGIQVEYLENMAVVTNTLEPGTPASATYEDGVLTLNIPKGEKGDPAPADEVAEATDAWLAENITNPSNPPLDRSLTLANAAAPADMVGDLKSAIMQTVMPTSDPGYESGYIDGGGVLVSDGNYYSSDYVKLPFIPGSKISLKVSLLSARGLAFYDGTKTYITGSAINGNNCSSYGYTAGSTPQSVLIVIPKGAVYIRFNQRSTFVTSASDFSVTGVFGADYLSDVAQIPGIKSDINTLDTKVGVNTESRKINVSFTDGGFIMSSGGVSENADYSYAQYVYVGGLKSVRMTKNYSGTGACTVVLDANKAVTRYFYNEGEIGDELTITLTDKEVYMSITCRKALKSSFYMYTDSIAESIAKTFRVLNGEPEVPFSKIIRDGGMTRIFNTIGVIGDSLSSGEMAYGDASTEVTVHYVDMLQYSWIQYIARECGITAYNFSQGGLNTRNFLSDLGGHLTDLQSSDKKCQAYFIALGHNDVNYDVPLGTTADINLEDPSQNEDTYYGNYARIISIIKTVQPNAKIFPICMKSSGYASYNEAIRYMATIYSNVYVLDFETYYPTLETSWEYTQGHGNAMGYLNYSWQIGTYVDYIIRNNRTDFKYVQFIGTDYDQYIPTGA